MVILYSKNPYEPFFIFTKDNIKGIVYTNTCDLSEIKTIVEKLNGEYVKSRGGVVFELKH